MTGSVIIESSKENKLLRDRPLIYSFTDNNKKPIIFFIHPISGKVFWYNDLCKSLPPFFQYKGIESIFFNKKFCEIENLEELSEIYAQEILDIQPAGPFILCGWSFGGTLAYEISNFLINSGHEVKSTINY